jgi:DNA-binding MarR family transcriptional regulator
MEKMQKLRRGDFRRLGNPGTPAFQVDKYPFYLLNRLVSRYNVIIGGRLHEIGIDIPFWRVLMVLGERAPRSIGTISEAAVINLSTMIRIVQRMAEVGLVSCLPRPADNRVIEVFLTRAGETKLAAARKITAPVYGEAIADFSEADFRNMTDLLNRVYNNLSHVSGPASATRKLRKRSAKTSP